MSTTYDRNRGGLESVLKRVARDYAMGNITKEQFDKFAETIEDAFKQIEAMTTEED